MTIEIARTTDVQAAADAALATALAADADAYRMLTIGNIGNRILPYGQLVPILVAGEAPTTAGVVYTVPSGKMTQFNSVAIFNNPTGAAIVGSVHLLLPGEDEADVVATNRIGRSAGTGTASQSQTTIVGSMFLPEGYSIALVATAPGLIYTLSITEYPEDIFNPHILHGQALITDGLDNLMSLTDGQGNVLSAAPSTPAAFWQHRFSFVHNQGPDTVIVYQKIKRPGDVAPFAVRSNSIATGNSAAITTFSIAHDYEVYVQKLSGTGPIITRSTWDYEGESL